MAHGARTLLQSSRAVGLDLGLITLVTGSAPVARTCAGATIVLSSVPYNGVGSSTVSGAVTLRVVPEDSSSAVLDWGAPLPRAGGCAGCASRRAVAALIHDEDATECWVVRTCVRCTDWLFGLDVCCEERTAACASLQTGRVLEPRRQWVDALTPSVLGCLLRGLSGR